ncbi:hypothetical protein N7603_05525 [Acholeplasma vituli]|uniref:Uncharacterized protein n=1 Tax=Paracholeplasma vituli TaxID=69473 RepID=A0ABT2PZN0_9MOLU|nr:hypothetical protein [Paracholeplasma vituli]MCU0105113.1 hypothetical protein [Paracholeplasma vituli]
MKNISGKIHTKDQLYNYANQKIPNSNEFKANQNNRANQLNTNTKNK